MKFRCCNPGLQYIFLESTNIIHECDVIGFLVTWDYKTETMLPDYVKGEGVKNAESLADVIYGCLVKPKTSETYFYSPHKNCRGWFCYQKEIIQHNGALQHKHNYSLSRHPMIQANIRQTNRWRTTVPVGTLPCSQRTAFANHSFQTKG